MNEIDETQLTVSERRVKLYHMRESTAKVVGSILTATGAVEALSEENPLQGVISVIIGLALEKESKDPSWLVSVLALLVVAPAGWKLQSRPKEELTSAIAAFVTALKCSCIYMLVRLLFWSLRLRQLGDLQKPKEL